MTMQYDYTGLSDDTLDDVAGIVALCFGSTRDDCATWMTSAGHEHWRIMRTADAAAACLLRVPMGQYFGGRSVPMVGVAGVGVAPEARGAGAAKAMMAAALGEMHQQGTPLSVLYASTQSLYRDSGYEQAGHRFEIRIPVHSIDVRQRNLSLRAMRDDDRPAIRACYTGFAAASNGMLDRGEYIWDRITKFRQSRYDGYVVVNESGDIEGYVYLLAKNLAIGRQELLVSDLAFTTAQAGQRLLTFFSDFGSLADEVVLAGGPTHPALLLLGQQRYRITLGAHWMLRIVHVARALEARGYASPLAASITLDVRDELLEGNNGRWTMHVEGGKANIERGGNGPAVSLSASALAPLYTGYLSARQLKLLRLLDGPDDALRACDVVFAGHAPWMSDGF